MRIAGASLDQLCLAALILDEALASTDLDESHTPVSHHSAQIAVRLVTTISNPPRNQFQPRASAMDASASWRPSWVPGAFVRSSIWDILLRMRTVPPATAAFRASKALRSDIHRSTVSPPSIADGAWACGSCSLSLQWRWRKFIRWLRLPGTTRSPAPWRPDLPFQDV